MDGGTFGVDEAGRGPVLGSMFAACVVVPDGGVLPDGIDDSKRLKPARREELDAALRADERIAVGVAEITPAEIDDPATDMNSLTVQAHAQAIEGVVRPGLTGVVDACDTSAERFARRVAGAVSDDVRVDADHGADESHAVVGAASVVAKVARDAHVAALADRHGDVGSGYPSDPTTRTFLADYVAEHGDLPDCARTSWGTCADVLAAASQSALGEF
jgi:ribonuclease HII